MKKTLHFFGGLSIVLTIALMAVGVTYAYKGNHGLKGKDFPSLQYEQMQKVLKTNDYQSWYDLMKDSKFGKKALKVINKDNFPKFVEANKLQSEGKTEEAKKIFEELGLGMNKGECERGIGRRGFEMKRGGFKNHEPITEEQKAATIKQKAEMNTVLENKNYEAWKALVTKNAYEEKYLKVINAENFAQFAEAKLMIKKGQEILEKLGVK